MRSSIRSRSSLSAQYILSVVADFIRDDAGLRATLTRYLEDEFGDLRKEVVSDLDKPAD